MSTRRPLATHRAAHRILIVDDDADLTEALQLHFAEAGYAVDTAATTGQAWEAVARALPSLILLGARLADTDGLSLFQQFRARPRTAHIPVIFFAARTEADVQNRALQAGADDFVAQPFDIDILALRVRNAIARTERDGVIEPRTGLPTGQLVQERLQRLSDEDGWARLDIAIQGFDAFRECYDFLTADEVLAFTASLLVEVAQAEGTVEDFVGHVQGHEFVVITQHARGAALAQRMAARFNDEVQAFYNFIDREQGYILLDDGFGGTKQAPLMTLSVQVQFAGEG